MNFQQLTSLCAIVDHGLNITKAATATHSTQPAISRQIRFLEKDLGIQIFHRNKSRLTGLTEAGEAAVTVARRLTAEAGNLARIGEEFSSLQEGTFTIATTHTFARYSLPAVIRRFASVYPNVRLILKQGIPGETAIWVAAGKADLFISSADDKLEDLVILPFGDFDRIVVVPKGHPLLDIPKVTLADIARYPIVTSRFKSRSTAKDHGIRLNVVLTADSDVIKTYVREGLGIGIVSALAYSPNDESDLRPIDVRHLFKPHTCVIGLKARSFLRTYVYDFIEMLVPKLKRKVVEKALAAAM